MSKKTVDIIAGGVGLVLMCALVGTVYFAVGQVGKEYSPKDYFSAIMLSLTAAFGVYYILSGCKKGRGSKYYVCYMGANTVCDLIAITGAAGFPAIGTACLAIAIASGTVLCFAKDLGQNRSTAFALIGLAAKLAVLIVFLAVMKGFSMNIAASTVLSAAALFMVCAKYYDKTLRGSF